jgi:CheY-like chemotaxis protein
MRILVIDDYIAAEDAVRAALESSRATQDHEVVGVRTPEELRQRGGLAGFDLAFVDLSFGRLTSQTGLSALRVLRDIGVPAVIYTADEEENRLLFLLAAFHFYNPLGLVSKRASRDEICHLVAVINAGTVPPSPATQRYERPRVGPSLFDQLIVRAEDLPVWRALGEQSDRVAIAKVACMHTRTLDKFLSDHSDAVEGLEVVLLGRTRPENPTAAPDRTKSVRHHEHRFTPIHAFAVTHHQFFQDPEVEKLIRERDSRPPPNRRRGHP